MKMKLIAAGILSVGLSSCAFAQMSTTGMPESWMGDIGAAFFSNGKTDRMRKEEEVKASWDTLTPAQQAQAKEDCKGAAAPGNSGDKAAASPGFVQACAWVSQM